MKLLSLIYLGFFLTAVCAQDFNVEYKAFMLQSFFKNRQIRTLTIEKSEDSLFANKQIQYKLQFDEEGRLVKIFDYYFDSDTVPERVITYKYNENGFYYKEKEYHYLDNMLNVVMRRKWLLQFDFMNYSLEEKFLDGNNQYRTNNLIFNKAMQILSRSVQAFVVKLRTGFTYGKDGLLRKVRIIKENPTVKKMKMLELNHYLKYNNFQKIMTTEQWVGEREKQVNEYYYIYKGQDLKTKVGWSLTNWSNSDEKLKEQTNFLYHSNGLLLNADISTERQEFQNHEYVGFKYSFFSGKEKVKGSSHKFTMLWFADIFAENVIQP